MSCPSAAATSGRGFVSRSQKTAVLLIPTPLLTPDLATFLRVPEGHQPQLGLLPECIQDSPKAVLSRNTSARQSALKAVSRALDTHKRFQGNVTGKGGPSALHRAAWQSRW